MPKYTIMRVRRMHQPCYLTVEAEDEEEAALWATYEDQAWEYGDLVVDSVDLVNVEELEGDA